MLKSAEKRLLRDFKKIQQEKSKMYAVAIDGDNIMKWNAVIFGPEGTDWEGGVFKLTFEFTSDYPQLPPTVKFVTIPFHPNVYQNGNICIDILQHNWSQAYDVSAILTTIIALLVDPNPNSPANNEAAEMYTRRRAEYSRMARQCVEATWTSSAQ